MKEDLRGQIRQMEQELRREEFREEAAPAAVFAPESDRAMFADEYYGPEKKSNPRARGVRYLLLLGILALIGWWLLCRM